MIKKRLVLILFIGYLLTVNCSPRQVNQSAIDEQVSAFRSRVANAKYNEIILEASSAFRASIEHEAFISALKSVADDVGDSSKFSVKSVGLSWDLRTSEQVVIRFEAKGTRRVLLDEFVFVDEDGQYRLYNYRFEF